jgi:capsule polysaccharide export protein KpsE/RkpR
MHPVDHVRKAMSNPVEKIVDTYVQLNDHQALEDLRTYRQRLAVHLKARANFAFSLLTGQIDAEIAVIEAGLNRLTELSAHERHAENRQRG